METIREVPYSYSRISWSAVIAGVVVGLATQALLNLLGLGLGFSAFTVDSDVMANIGMGSIIWFIATGTIALFVGGWVAGRLANSDLLEEGLLHGIVTWGLAMLVGFALVATTAGAIISGMASVVGQGITLTGQSVTALGKTAMQVAPDVADTVKNITPNFSDALNQIKQQADLVLTQALQTSSNNASNNLNANADGNANANASDTNSENSSANAGNTDSENASNNAAASDQSTNVQQSANQLKALLEKAVTTFFTAANDTDKATAQQKLFNFLTQNLGMSRDQAAQTINEWQQQYNDLKAQMNQKAQQAKQTAIAATEQTSNVMGTISIISFFVLLLGAVASAIGGIVGVTTFRKSAAGYPRR